MFGDLRFHQLSFHPGFIKTRIQKEVCKPQGPSSIWEMLTLVHTPQQTYKETGPPRVGTQPQGGGAGEGAQCPSHHFRAPSPALGHAQELEATSSQKGAVGQGAGPDKAGLTACSTGLGAQGHKHR